MKLQLDFKIDTSTLNIKYGDEVVLLGSCFSDTMTSHFETSGFKVLSNPFGTLFHPLAVANVIDEAISPNKIGVVQRDDLYFSWLASGKLFARSEFELEKHLTTARNKLIKSLKKSRLLIVSFGSAWGYIERDFGIVANCHKMPHTQFDKKLSTVDLMALRWNEILTELKRLNPQLNVVFTVSPVRHFKDGLVENNRSKSRLIEFTHQLSSRHGFYFPSYEIVIDQLRDYRFYKNDLVHPSDDAVAYVWESFSQFLFSEHTLSIVKKVKQIKMTLNHKSLYPGSKLDGIRIKAAKEQQQQLIKKIPDIFWE